MTDDLLHGNDQSLTANDHAEDVGLPSGAEGAAALIGQAQPPLVVSRPGAGQTVVLDPTPGQTIVLNFEPGSAQVMIVGDDLVLGFDDDGDGTADSSIVFQNLASAAAEEVSFQIGGATVGADILASQALALAGEGEVPLDDVAAGPGGLGGGASAYSDNLGSILDLLVAQGVIPPVFLEFGLIDTENDPVAFVAAPEAPLVVLIHDESRGVQNADGEDDVDYLPPALQAIYDQMCGCVYPQYQAAFARVQMSSDSLQAMGKIPFGPGESVSLNAVVNGTPSGLFTGGIEAPKGINLYNYGDNVIVGSTDGEEVVFIVYLDDATGEIWFVQCEPINHDDPFDHDEADTPELLNLFYTVSGVGGSTTGPLQIQIQDDGPTADLEIYGGAVIRLDETDNDADDGDVGGLLAQKTVNPWQLFHDYSDFGFDGKGSKVFSLTLGESGETGLVDTQSGEAVVLAWDGADIVGRTEIGGEEVFRISINADTGAVTVTQSRALVHGDPEDHDEADTPLTLPEGLVGLEVKVTDGDGDSDGDAIELGSLIKFEDDGPSIDVTGACGNPASRLKLNLDETIDPDGNATPGDGADTYALGEGVDGNGDLDDILGQPAVDGSNPIGKLTTTAEALAGLFNVTKDAGSDGEKSLTHAFKLVLSDQGLASSLVVTPAAPGGNPAADYGDHKIYLYSDGDHAVVGRVGGAEGPIALRITLSDPDTSILGDETLTVEQYLAIGHGDDGNLFDSALKLLLPQGSLSVELTSTITDGDDDTASDSHSVTVIDHCDSFVKIDDDGPKVELAADATEDELRALNLVLDESIGNDPAGPNGLAGAADDVQASTMLSTDPDSTHAIGKQQTGAGLLNVLFKESVAADFGTDGEAARSDVLKFELGGTTAETKLVVTALEGTVLETMDAAQRTISLKVSDDGKTVDGVIPGTAADGDEFVAFRIFLANSTDPESAYLVVEQFLPIDHGADSPSLLDEALELLMAEGGSLGLTLTTTLTDGDGDIVESSATVTLIDAEQSFVTFEDDGPSVTVCAKSQVQVTHDETPGDDGADDAAFAGLPAEIQALFAAVGAKGSDADVADADKDEGALGFAQSLGALVAVNADYGTDGAASADAVKYALALGEATDGLVASGVWTTEGEAIYLFLENGVIVGRVDTDNDGVVSETDPAAFAIAIDPDSGEVFLSQWLSLKHLDTENHDEPLTLIGEAVQVVVTVTDGDGDQASDAVGIGSQIVFEDDGPSIEVTGDQGSLRELALNLDETIDPDQDGEPDNADFYNAVVAETESDGGLPNGDLDDTGVSTVGDGQAAIGKLTTSAGAVAGLFNVEKNAGSDGEKSVTHAFKLVLSAEGLASNLSVTPQAEGGNPAIDGDLKIYFYAVDEHTVEGRVGGENGPIALRITLENPTDPDTVHLAVEQYLAIDHGDDNNLFDSALDLLLPQGSLSVELTVTIVDGDGDTASDSHSVTLIDGNTGFVSIDDDGPQVAMSLKDGATLVLDESLGAKAGDENAADEEGTNSPDAIGFGFIAGADLFTLGTAAGTDGVQSTVFGLKVGSEASGLVDVETGFEVLLSQDPDGNVLGAVTVGDDTFTVFEVSVDPATGGVTVTQFRAVKHDDFADHDEAGSPEMLDPGALLVTVTVTDGDGDTASDEIDLAPVIKFEDDGPTASISLYGGSVTHDETIGVDDDADDTLDPDLYGLFSSVVNKPVVPLGHATSTTPVVSIADSDGGEDGLWSVMLSLEIVGGDGTPSGLATTDGQEIKLFLEPGGYVVGRVMNGDVKGVAAFAVAIHPDGKVSVAQYLSLQHPDHPDNFDEPVDLEGLVKAVVTITDGDGDVDTASVEIGAKIVFEDDGPSITVAGGQGTLRDLTLNLDETTDPEGDASINGGDTYALGEGADDNGDLDDILGQLAPDGSNPIGKLTTQPGKLSNLFSVAKDAGADGEKSVSHTFKLVLSGTGLASTLLVTPAAAGGNPTNDYGDHKIYFYAVDEHTVEGRVGGIDGPIALRITLENPTDPDTVHLVVEQFLAIDHGKDGNLFDSELPLHLVEGSLSVELTATITDGDNDTASDSHNVTLIDDEVSFVAIDDDGPKVELAADATEDELEALSLVLDESIGNDPAGPNGLAGSADDVASSVTLSTDPESAQAIGKQQTGAGLLNVLFKESTAPDYGTDGEGDRSDVLKFELGGTTAETKLVVTALEGTALETMDAAQRTVSLKVSDDGTVVEGVIPGTAADGDEFVAFRITLMNPEDPESAYLVVEQFLPIDHGADDPSLLDEALKLLMAEGGTLGLTLTTTLTDGDGDTVESSATVTLIDAEQSFVTFEDDGPTAADDGQLATVDDEAAGVVIGTVAQLLANDSYGTDGKHVTSGLAISDGDLGGTIAIVDGNLVYTSHYDVAPGATAIETFTYTITDGDGDTTTAAFTVKLTDTGATIGDPEDSQVDEEGLAKGNHGDSYDEGDLPGHAVTVSGNLDIDFGDDTPGTVTFDAVQPELAGQMAGGEPVKLAFLNGNTLLIGYTGDTEPTDIGDSGVVFHVSLDATGSGSYSFTLVRPFDHAESNTEDDVTLIFAFTAKDSEGEGGSATFTVTVDDDAPLAPTVTLSEQDPVALTFDGGLPQGNFKGPEEDGDTNASPLVAVVDFSVAFDFANENDFGADGPGTSARSFALKLAVDQGTDSGLTSDGQAIYLYEVNGEIIGSTAADAASIEATNTVFTLSVNGATGVVTLTQSGPVDHGTEHDYDGAYLNDVAELGCGLVQLTASASTTDYDGDSKTSNTATFDLGGNVRFGDDGPEAKLSVYGGPIVLDETENDGDDAADDGLLAKAVVSGALLFTDTSSFGADGAADMGSKVFSLTLTQENADSGLVDVESGAPVVLGKEGDDIVGRADGAEVFRISVNPDTGEVTVTQSRAVKHDDPNDHDEATSPEVMDSGLVLLTVKVTDGDGDTDSASIELGSRINFEDDGPQAFDNTACVNEVVGVPQNVTLVVDVSASISGSEFTQMRAALQQLISEYAELGVPVTITMIPFAGGVGTIQTFSFTNATDPGFISLSDAIGNLGQGYGGVNAFATNYEAALEAAKTDLEADLGSLPGNTNHTVYFLSDGEPNQGDTSVPIAGWDDFLDDNPGITSIAVGFGFAPNDPDNNFLVHIGGGSALYLQEASDLLDTFTGSVSIGQSVSGNVITDGENTPGMAGTVGVDADAGGSDGLGHIVSVTYDGVTYTTAHPNYNAVTKLLTIETDYGKLVIQMEDSDGGSAGDYTYTAKPAVQHGLPGSETDEAITETFTYAVSDGDGDTAEADLIIKIKDDVPVAHDDTDKVEEGGVTHGNVLTGVDPDVLGTPDTGDDGDLKADVFGPDGPDAAGGVVGVAKGDTEAPLDDANSLSTEIHGDYGTLVLNADGSYTYTQTAKVDSEVEDIFTYTIKDGDGDLATATLKITITPNLDVLVVGRNVDDTEGATEEHVIDETSDGPVDGPIVGTGGQDVLIGDVGGGNLSGKVVNLALVLDVSTSMSSTITYDNVSMSRTNALDKAVEALLQNLSNTPGATIRVHIVTFGTDVVGKGTFDILVNGVVQPGFQQAKDFSLQTPGTQYTNYEAGFHAALEWFRGNTDTNPLPDADYNQTIFMSDGEPNRWYGGDGTALAGMGTSGNPTAVTHVLGSGDGDTYSEVNAPDGLKSYGPVSIIGLDVGSTALNYLTQIGGADNTFNVTTGEDLEQVFGDLSQVNTLSDVGGDSIVGGAGDDLIFGDTINTDALKASLPNGHPAKTLPDGAGWAVIQAMIANDDFAGATDQEIYESIREFLRDPDKQDSLNLGAETIIDGVRRGGGDDTIDGGDGNDTIYGQEGADLINGGNGDDLIVGGTGNDTMTGGDGRDTFRWTAADHGGATGGTATTIYNFANSAAVARSFEVDPTNGNNTGTLSDLVGGPNVIGPGGLNQTQGYGNSVDVTADAGLDLSDNIRFVSANPGGANEGGQQGDNQVFWAEFTIAEPADDITRIDLLIEGQQGGNPGAPAHFGVWNHFTGTWDLVNSQTHGSDGDWTIAITQDVKRYLSVDNKVTMVLMNQDDAQHLEIDYVEVKVTAEVQGTIDVAVDTITDFHFVDGVDDPDEDVLDLRDLLQLDGPATASNLANYLHFSYDGTDTTIHVDYNGAGVGGAGFQETLDIVLQNSDLGSLGNNQEIIQAMLDGGNLLVS